jgi:hypothetical protein
MITATVVGNDTVVAWAEEWLRQLNQAEVERRIEVNEAHVAEYGRELYPEGGQYATFTLDRSGRKYTRIVMTAGGQRSVHAFVDLRTGDVYKAAGWGKPAPGVRFNLMNAASRERMFARMTFTGGYLYR